MANAVAKFKDALVVKDVLMGNAKLVPNHNLQILNLDLIHQLVLLLVKLVSNVSMVNVSHKMVTAIIKKIAKTLKYVLTVDV